MRKIRLGKTEMMVTQLGLGGIPIQRLTEDAAIAVVRRCLELGINFIDTAHLYTTSEERIGKAIAGRRDEVFLATKSTAQNRENIEKHLQTSLERLGVKYLDLYQFHQVGDLKALDKVLATDGAITVLEAAKRAGVIGHIGITTHQIDVAKAAVKSDRFETVMFPFNFITREPAEELLPLAREHDVGFIAMKPLAGGMLGNAAVAFKYLFQFPDVLLIPGIEKPAEIEEIVALLEGPPQMTEAEQAEMQRLRKELGRKFCRRCDYCQPCPQGIQISSVMAFSSFVKRQVPEFYLSKQMAEIMEKVEDCIKCGECEMKCPYHLRIRAMIARNLKLYREEKRKHQL